MQIQRMTLEVPTTDITRLIRKEAHMTSPYANNSSVRKFNVDEGLLGLRQVPREP